MDWVNLDVLPAGAVACAFGDLGDLRADFVLSPETVAQLTTVFDLTAAGIPLIGCKPGEECQMQVQISRDERKIQVRFADNSDGISGTWVSAGTLDVGFEGCLVGDPCRSGISHRLGVDINTGRYEVEILRDSASTLLAMRMTR